MKEETKILSIGEALDLAVQFAMAGNHKNAETMLRGVLKHEPENFEAIERLGSILFETKRYHEALYWFWRGRKMNRRHPLALTNYGLCISQLGHPDEGVADLERAVHHAERMPHMSDDALALIYNNLGNTLERLKRHAEALTWLDKGIAKNPNDPFPRYNRGIVLMRLNRHLEAVAELDTAIALKPDDHEARYNRAMGNMLLGNMREGWADYESRLLTAENEVPNLGLPADKQWHGEEMAGKRLLVHAEQGLGDDIQFLRYLPLLKERTGANIGFVCHAPVKPFAEQIPGVTVLETGANLEYERWVALMSLPHKLGLDTEADIPPPYLPPIDEERIAKWRQYAPAGAMNVGICWAGQFQHKNDEHRSIALKTFAKLFDAPCNFVSLQQMREEDMEPLADLKAKHQNLSALYLDDLRDTAAIITSLDLVVSVDTAVAHLAASLGKPTFILIPAFGTDWRWQLGRRDSPWYPSATLYRQPKVGDWASVIQRLRADISVMAARQAAA